MESSRARPERLALACANSTRRWRPAATSAPRTSITSTAASSHMSRARLRPELTTVDIDVLVRACRLTGEQRAGDLRDAVRAAPRPNNRAKLVPSTQPANDFLLIVEPVLMAPLPPSLGRGPQEAQALGAARGADARASATVRRAQLGTERRPGEQADGRLRCEIAAVRCWTRACGSGKFYLYVAQAAAVTSRRRFTSSSWQQPKCAHPSVGPEHLHGSK